MAWSLKEYSSCGSCTVPILHRTCPQTRCFSYCSHFTVKHNLVECPRLSIIKDRLETMLDLFGSVSHDQIAQVYTFLEKEEMLPMIALVGASIHEIHYIHLFIFQVLSFFNFSPLLHFKHSNIF